MRRINKLFPLWALYSLLVPAILGFVLHGFTLEGALRGLVWGGLVRAFFLHHITWSINSVCHYFGNRRFATDDLSTNVFWLALPSMGESWHHNHHAFPRSAQHGLRWWEIDISALVITRDGEGRPRVERRPHLARAPGGQGGRAQEAGRGLRYQAAERVSRRGGSSRTIGAANGRTIMRAGLGGAGAVVRHGRWGWMLGGWMAVGLIADLLCGV